MITADGSAGDMMPVGEIMAAGDGNTGDGEEDLSIEASLFYTILEEKQLASPSGEGDIFVENLQGEPVMDTGSGGIWHLQSGSQMIEGADGGDESVGYAVNSIHNLEGSDARVGHLGGSFDYAEKQMSSSMHACSGSNRECCLPFQEDQGTMRDGVLKSEIASSSTESTTFADGVSSCIADHARDLNLNLLLDENGNQLRHVEGNVEFRDASHGSWIDSSDEKFGSGDALVKNSLEILEPENDIDRSMGVQLMNTDVFSHDMTSLKSDDWHYPEFDTEFSNDHSAMQFGMNEYDTHYTDSPQCNFSSPFNFGSLHNNQEIIDFQPESACSGSEISMTTYSDINRMNVKYEDELFSGNFSSRAEDELFNDKASVMRSSYIQLGISEDQTVHLGDEKTDGSVVCRDMTWQSGGVTEAVDRKCSWSDGNGTFVDEDKKQSSSGLLSSVQSQNHVIYTKDDRGGVTIGSSRAQVEGVVGRFPLDSAYMNLNASEQFMPYAQTFNISNKQLSYGEDEELGISFPYRAPGSHLSIVSPESIESNSSGSKSHVDDDPDICIIDDISQLAFSNQSYASIKPTAPLQQPTYNDPLHHSAVEGTRLRVNDERHVLQVALQDLAQPKSEAVPPDGVLAVPLLRHQRIALSWMVQKETCSSHCSGGILADDQGLGKTVSTIALILKERAPHRADAVAVKKEECETLNLDDDDGFTEIDRLKKGAVGSQVTSNRSSIKSLNSSGQSKGRPAAGTLIVCPTSVLRQWADELHKKVTTEANLSVLVYHGSNRTKDPSELAKYDVVITTYSIVSMEVPRQPLADEDDEEKRRMEGDDAPHLGFSYNKKRKTSPSSGKKGSKNKKRMDSAMLESIARPLAKVAWFRVVLDEAQSIKNHRTQAARACWGLRAKRRWCLSGTPIQNAIDDLYSYFRFLRYDPYAGYKLFCSAIKVPIQKNPATGYKKLQAVLKTVMLRRTKGTFLDGEPIINLPPRIVELKKVDFTEEEREFYTRLEIDSQAQFKEYAAAGTVKQNYVNILLMLLRLRQACDHPCLVSGLDSRSLGNSSVEMAKKLPREKQLYLLNRLEASLAICRICSDAPEDAVVSVCGHVFCRQCICEHLIGDDSQCPVSDCKVRLNVSSVFSKATLNSSLSDEPGQDCSGSELVAEVRSFSDSRPHDSSKIRAALEVLQSLTKPNDCLPTCNLLENSVDENVACHEASSGSTDSVKDGMDKRHIPIKAVGEKAIVFSQWTGMLDLLEACLKSSSIQYRRLDGTMSVIARDKALKDFNTLPEVSVMIMSLKAASLGLNMVAACHVLLLDLWWNPTTEDQAIDRAHRIGQTRTVTVLRLTVQNTVEDRILALQPIKVSGMRIKMFAFGQTRGQRDQHVVDFELIFGAAAGATLCKSSLLDALAERI
ncbi:TRANSCRIPTION TERMINATION FACTOR 2-RELATED [Salix purpurea]|uniref:TRANSCRIPTION TERMINATION FACTOR 2-RELATED n=1 Tax=Salix purpurea TaxID=77065 RepID=A0A9Q0WQA4_SALPP|nr:TRANSCRIPTION TERMINATION FACTOR 2-RELATED [Salix purpurea]